MKTFSLRASALWAFFACLACIAAAQPSAKPIPSSSEAAVAQRFLKLRSNPLLLHAFLWQMPKGGDLHNHLSGAAYAEHFIQLAADSGLCIDRSTMTAESCKAPENNACDASREHESAWCALSDPVLYRSLIDAWSMRNYARGPQSGHDHFFDTFGKFDAASNDAGALMAEVADRAARQNEQYLELMVIPGLDGAFALGSKLGWNMGSEAPEQYFERARAQLNQNGLGEIVAAGRKWLDAQEATMRRQLGCNSSQPQPGCTMTIRYVAEVLRGFPREVVFAQIAASFEIAKQDARVVSVNPVMPEDGYTSMTDYDLHMRMFAYFHRLYPEVRLTMHAGELAPGLVPPAGLRNHIREAIAAGAERIGHGVDVMYEDRPFELLHEMAQKHVAVEICLTSNDGILSVTGDRHPFPIYLRYGVPVVIATDDEGVSRSDMTREYERAVETYGIAYPELKSIVRNSITYSFLPPAEKTAQLKDLEARFAVFEREMLKQP
ncbi:MAG: adenosine deaminase [Acidobacteria bacterium]|nr:adenosine deaminase [Acidobacteriota bacterium]